MMPVDVSIVIPTYNPQERIISRLLHALEAMEVPDGADVEYAIVDNNSTPPVRDMPCVRDFLRARGARAGVVRESAQGLTFARLAGIRATTGQLVVMFDDDNVPAPSYLRVVLQCARDLPWVGVWGPGSIDVELLDPVPEWLKGRARQTHNQRREQFVRYGCVPASWQEYYPIGMGQVIRRAVADSYRSSVEAGDLNSTDRKGGSLASGGDTQIVWRAINMGLAAGIHPDLRMTHLIPGSRATLAYMKRLAFGCGMSYYPSIAQSFPRAFDAADANLPTTRQQATELLRFVLGYVRRGRLRFLSLDFANRLGLMCGRLAVGGYGDNHWVFKLARRLRLT
jgi:hypothetical protein